MRGVADTELRPPLFTVALISACALAYEVLLTRLFSIIQWHHFAYMIISLALLGYGISGAFLSITRPRLVKRFRLAFLTNVALFGVSVVGCFEAAQSVPFNAEELLWDPLQFLRLLAVYLLLALPFFFVANAVALSLMCQPKRLSRIYAFDLVGAGIGSLAVIALLFAVLPLRALYVLGAVAVMAVAVGAWELSAVRRVLITAASLLAVVLLSLVSGHTQLSASPYKDLSQTLRVAGTRVVDERSSPLGYLSVLETSEIPLRHAPGLSIRAESEPPRQVAIYTDGDNMTVISEDDGVASRFAYLDQMTSALPYHLKSPFEHVLLLGVGGGTDIHQARLHDVNRITAVELNPQVVDIARERYGDFADHIFDRRGVDLHISEARGFVTRSQQRYDLIQVALLDSFAASSAGLYALNESYLYTVEALRTYWERLMPGGYLAITRWVKLPPRDALKLLATAADALRGLGVVDPGAQLLLIRGWQTSTLVMKNGAVTPDEITALRVFSQDNAFDVAWYPGIQATEVNRFNVLRQPYFYQSAQDLLGGRRQELFDRYKYDIRPATDDRPYFFHFFKWQVLPEIVSLRGRGGTPLLELGYLVLVATLFKAVIASVVLILLPLVYWRRRHKGIIADGVGRMRVFTYFFAVGLAFLFIEIAFIQKFLLFLYHPLYAVSVVLTSFLVFAGLGSAASGRFARTQGYRLTAGIAIFGIFALTLSYMWALGPVFDQLSGLPTALKVGSSILLIAPVAFCMGMPFPLGLGRLSDTAESLVPWAWGVNGCASVISAVLATLIAIHGGFSTVVLIAGGMYAVAWLCFPKAPNTAVEVRG